MKNVSVNGTNYTGVSEVQLSVTGGGTANFRDVDEITTPSGSINITANGTHNVSAYAQAVVNVSASGSDDSQALLNALLEGKGGTVTIPEGTLKIKDYAFYSCKNVSVKMADSVESIGASAFAYGEWLVVSKLPNSLKSIGDRAFQYGRFSSNTTELIIPANVGYIGSLAFSTLYSPSIATFKGTPSTIKSDAFYNSSIKTLNVPWAEGAVTGAPWGATTVNYNYTGE